MISTPLLKTKITILPKRSYMVGRPNLLEKLEAARSADIVLLLVSAKAGAGKSSLISTWIEESTLDAAWLSLDHHDNEPTRFLRYLAGALDQLEMLSGINLPAVFESQTLPDPEMIFGPFLEALLQTGNEVLLVLDDYHVIHHEWIHKFIGTLVERLGHGIHLIMITRTDPPLPLSRLRARGQMIEIRDSDLRFNHEETRQYLNDIMQLDLSPEQISILEGRTEGWIAGLQMAGITIRERMAGGRIDEFIHGFGGSHRYVLDYLMDEVMAQQPPFIKDFLLQTSILERLCAELCDRVRFGFHGADQKTSQSSDQKNIVELQSQNILQQLEKSNLFLIPLDDERKWYRYHHLFGDLLRHELMQRSSLDKIRELHQHASLWHEQQGSVEEAMSHAIEAEDFSRAAAMIEENIVGMLSQSEVPVLLGWIERLPEDIIRSRPWIEVYRANTLAFAGQIKGVEKILSEVEKHPGTDPDSAALKGHIAAVRAYVANLSGDPERTIEMASLSKDYLSEDHLSGLSMAVYALGDAHFALDDIDKSEEAFQELLRLGEQSGQLMMIVTALCELANLRKVQGRLTEANKLYSRAWAALVDLNGLGTRLRCHYEFGLADLLYEWNLLDEAHKHAKIGMEIRARLGGYYVTGDLPMMHILQAQGDPEGALDVLHNVEGVVASAHVQHSGTIALRSARVIQSLAVGDIVKARAYANSCKGGTELELLAKARVLITEKRFEEALTMLQPQVQTAKEDDRIGRLVQFLCLQALCLDELNHPEDARTAITEALKLARPEGFVRTFLDIGKPLEDLIKRTMLAEPMEGMRAAVIDRLVQQYARELLDAFVRDRKIHRERLASLEQEVQSGLSIEVLTERELEVVTLLAEGLSNKALADRLVVAPSTIKQHLKNIYAKLGVHNRTEAVARAKEANLIE